MKELVLGIKAGFSLFYLNTYEPNAAIDDVKKELEELKENGTISNIKEWDFTESGDPSEVIEMLSGENAENRMVVIAKNLNWFMQEEVEGSRTINQFLLNNIEKFSTAGNRRSLVVVSADPIEKAIPACLVQHFRYIEFKLPDREEIKELWEAFKEDYKENPNWKLPDDEKLVIEYARGLTRTGVVNAFSLATIKGKGKIDPLEIAYLRAEEIEKTPGVKLGKFGKNFSSLKGYDVIKRFVKTTGKSKLAKGVLLLGPPGVGKTHFAECVANELGLLCIIGELAELMGEGLVGQAEAAYKKFIQVVVANAPCVLVLDEVEKGLSGVNNKGTSGDSTTKKSASQLLKLMSNEVEREGLYIMGTCNEKDSLPPEWLRAERWDGVFYIPLPNSAEQKAILDHYMKEYDVKGKAPNMKGWSGAEIKTCCRLAKMMNTTLDDASKFVIPISKTKKEEIEALEKWAFAGNCLIASTPEDKKEIKTSNKRAVDF